MGGRQAVAEAYRNLVARGARPLAATDNLNFGDVTDPRVMGQLVGAVQGIGEACAALDMPIVSGNVSLYNATERADGTVAPILPTPTVGAVGLVEPLGARIDGRVRTGMIALLLGGAGTHLGRSALLQWHLGREAGPPPPVDLDAERRHGAFLLANRAYVTACTDLSDGGLALAAFTLAEASGVGVTLDVRGTAALFGEDQGRYLLAVTFDAAETLMVAAGRAGVGLAMVGQFGGDLGDVRRGERADGGAVAALPRAARGARRLMFVTLEGIDGSGKSTQARLLAEALRAEGRDVVLTREPGGAPGAEAIRALVLEGEPERWSPETETLLFTAARRDHLERTIRPALARGAWVVCDRFVDSTRAFQGATRGDLRAFVDTLHAAAIGVEPDRTLVVDTDPEVALARGLARGGAEVRFERFGLGFQRAARAGFLALAAAEPGRVRVVDGDGPVEAVAGRVRAALA